MNSEIKQNDETVTYNQNKRNIEIAVRLQPIEESQQYIAKIITKVYDPSVKVFITYPNISKYAKETKIPHTYADGSICLYLPGNNEWSYYDSWAKTLIPWTCLWLYYYELWLVTGEWLGGGAHPRSENENRERRGTTGNDRE